MKSLRLIVLFFITMLGLQATSLRDSIEDTLNNNPSIIASHINRDAYLKYVEQEEGDYLPTLDLDAYVEKSKTHNDPDQSPPAKGWSEKDGWNVALKLAYVLYDGGLTPAQVGEYQHKYNANKFRSIYDVENTIYETISTYIDLVQSQELLALAEDNIKIHEKYLDVAKEKEEISGEVLETHQVNSKYHSVLDRYLEQEKEEYTAENLYKKLVGKELDGDICRPKVDEAYIPKNVKEAVEIGLRRSFKINEQIEKIKEQREKIAQERAGFLPTIKFELQGQWDDDLELPENGRQDVYRGRIYLNWNLFNGGKTVAATEKEKLFLKEEQKKLDEITSEVVEEINVAYYTFFNTKKRVDNLTKYVDDNYNILMVYKKQLADGTRTFIDILNAESELYRSDIDKIDQEKELMVAYYDLLNKMSMLSDVILMQPKQVCSKYVFTPRKRDFVDPNSDTSISDDLKELFLDNSAPLETINDIAPQSNASEPQSLDSIYGEPDNTAAIDIQDIPLEQKTVQETAMQEDIVETTSEFNVENRLDRLYADDPYGTALDSELNKSAKKQKSTTLQRAQDKDEVVQEKIVPKKNVPVAKTTAKKKPTSDAKEQYTINIATLDSNSELKEFIKEYSLEEGAYYYKFGKNRDKIKLIYGKYDTVTEAKNAIKNLKRGIRDYVYVDNLDKHLDLELKYNGDYNAQSVLKGKYTINVATVYSESELNRYINEYRLKKGNYSYKFGENGNKIKLLYGGYDTLKEAKEAVAKLPKGIRNYVYVDSIQKHIELEKKYKEFN